MAKSSIRKFMNDLDDALDKGMGRFLQESQGKLIQQAPVDSGRFASSWFIGRNSPDLSVATERPKGAADVVQKPYAGTITADGNWYISNNLPYAERVSLDPKWSKGAKGGPAWYTTIVNNLDRDAEDAFEFYLKKLK